MLYFYLICIILIVLMMIHITLRDKPRFQRNRVLSLDLFRYADISDALKVIQDEADVLSVEYPEKKLGEFLLDPAPRANVMIRLKNREKSIVKITEDLTEKNLVRSVKVSVPE
ncbi:MAG: hypothetical protein IKM87_06335 [Clostridia bacterium]|nr:hypothetical protein [Clostridia bacterium]MBR6822763.1 hypothetical protein [Clostridia bacterium]